MICASIGTAARLPFSANPIEDSSKRREQAQLQALPRYFFSSQKVGTADATFI